MSTFKDWEGQKINRYTPSEDQDVKSGKKK